MKGKFLVDDFQDSFGHSRHFQTYCEWYLGRQGASLILNVFFSLIFDSTSRKRREKRWQKTGLGFFADSSRHILVLGRCHQKTSTSKLFGRENHHFLSRYTFFRQLETHASFKPYSAPSPCNFDGKTYNRNGYQLWEEKNPDHQIWWPRSMHFYDKDLPQILCIAGSPPTL